MFKKIDLIKEIGKIKAKVYEMDFILDLLIDLFIQLFCLDYEIAIFKVKRYQMSVISCDSN